MPYKSFFPNKEQFASASGEADLIPVCRKIVADLDTPLTLYAKVAGTHDHIFLFEKREKSCHSLNSHLFPLFLSFLFSGSSPHSWPS